MRCFDSLPYNLELYILRIRPRHHQNCLDVIKKTEYFIMIRTLLDDWSYRREHNMDVPTKVLYDVFRLGMYKTISFSYR